MYRYAQLNQRKICVGISLLSGEVDAENMISISDDAEVLGLQYNSGIWKKLNKLEKSEVSSIEQEQTDIQKIMQVMSDVELRDLKTQQNQGLLAQQMAELELLILGGNT
ncbi:hypothetical protein [Anaerotignum propionicum]|uniref:hypothetical protein n=1 Tax=Anaerotignum propionicum TaxID=28446 RepID=UPI00210918F3|nr:hypothetical protein [Anaerotignum propionicum]MCQ4935130.1 hypothetical protein [Anaerotignum propionicum]